MGNMNNEWDFKEELYELDFLKKPLNPYAEMWGMIQKKAKDKHELIAEKNMLQDKFHKVLCDIAKELFKLQIIIGKSENGNVQAETREDLRFRAASMMEILNKEGIRIIDPTDAVLDLKTLETVEVRAWREDERVTERTVHETLEPWVFLGEKLINTAIVIGKKPV